MLQNEIEEIYEGAHSSAEFELRRGLQQISHDN